MQPLEYGPSRKQLVRDLAVALLAVAFCAWLIDPPFFQAFFIEVEPRSSMPVEPGLRRIFAIVLIAIFAARALKLADRFLRPYPNLTMDDAGLTFHLGRQIAHPVPWKDIAGVESRRHNKQLFLRLRILAISLAPSAIMNMPRPPLIDRSFSDDFRVDGSQILLLAHNISPAISVIEAEIKTLKQKVSA